MVILSAIHETTAAAVLTVVAADELASSSASGFSRAGAAAGTVGSTLSGEPNGEFGWEILPSSDSVSRELVSAFSISSLSVEDLGAAKVCPMRRKPSFPKCSAPGGRTGAHRPLGIFLAELGVAEVGSDSGRRSSGSLGSDRVPLGVPSVGHRERTSFLPRSGIARPQQAPQAMKKSRLKLAS